LLLAPQKTAVSSSLLLAAGGRYNNGAMIAALHFAHRR